MHVASFKNESQVILVFCDFALHKKKCYCCNVMYFEGRKLFSFTSDTSPSDSFTSPKQFFTTLAPDLLITDSTVGGEGSQCLYACKDEKSGWVSVIPELYTQ